MAVTMAHFKLTLTGTASLLMHNARLADPLDPVVEELKKITSKMRKTREDHENIARMELLGGLYYDDELGPYLPADNVIRMMRDAAKTRKMQPKIIQGVFVTSDMNALAYDGPRKAEEIANDKNFVHRSAAVVGQQRVMRTRPMFREWAVQCEGFVDPTVIDIKDLDDILTIGGMRIGLGDWRPRYGRFTHELVQVSA